MATVRALESFAAEVDGGFVSVAKDQAFDSNDPIVKARKHLFASDEAAPRRGRPPKVEQATAAPGEVRDLP